MINDAQDFDFCNLHEIIFIKFSIKFLRTCIAFYDSHFELRRELHLVKKD